MKLKLIFLVTEDWYFYMHRLPQARAAQQAGFDVCVATRVRDHGTRIKAEGFRLFPLDWRRGSLDPLETIASIRQIHRLYRREKPDLVHHVALKAILLGTIAARLVGITSIVNAFTGLGLLFLGSSFRIRLLRAAVFPLLRVVMNSIAIRAIVENPDHMAALVRLRMVRPRQAVLIRGSGIDTNVFHPADEPVGRFTVGCASRLLRSKGILVLSEAFGILERRGVEANLLLAGAPDNETPDTLVSADLDRIAAQSNIQCLGRIDDMPAFWGQCHAGVLASITGEGLPVSLLEAAACGRAVIATDVPGCREIAIDGQTGLLVQPGDARQLADAIERLANDRALRLAYGAQARLVVEQSLSAQQVGRQTVSLYHSLMDARR